MFQQLSRNIPLKSTPDGATRSPSLLVHDIVIDCAPDDVRSQALDGLALVIFDIEGSCQLDLEKKSETTWKHSGIVKMYISFLLYAASVN